MGSGYEVSDVGGYYLQSRGPLRLSNDTPLHHLSRLSGSFGEVMTQLLRPTLQARNRPANVVLSDGVRETVTIRDDLAVTPTI